MDNEKRKKVNFLSPVATDKAPHRTPKGPWSAPKGFDNPLDAASALLARRQPHDPDAEQHQQEAVPQILLPMSDTLPRHLQPAPASKDSPLIPILLEQWSNRVAMLPHGHQSSITRSPYPIGQLA